MARYLIKELENLSGIKAHTIRIWEKRYRIIVPSRTDTNIRYYSDEDLKKLLNITMLNRHGIKISEIAKMTEKDMAEKVMDITMNLSNTDSIIEAMIIAMIDLDEVKFSRILSRFMMSDGFEKTIIKIVFPFLKRIGLLWQTGVINPLQEHFISNLFRQKIMVAIDNVDVTDNQEAKKFVLFLPEGEYHEIALLFFNFLVKKAGHLAYYLGASVPLEDLLEINRVVNPDYLLGCFTTSIDIEHTNEYIEKLAKTYSLQTIFITGGLVDEGLIELPANVKTLTSADDFNEVLKTIK